MPQQRVAVTGGSGRLGPYVVAELAGAYAVTVIDRVPPRDGGVDYIEADVTDYESMRSALDGCDALVHLAAVPNPRTSNPQTCFRVNALGTWAALQAAEDGGRWWRPATRPPGCPTTRPTGPRNTSRSMRITRCARLRCTRSARRPWR